MRDSTSALLMGAQIDPASPERDSTQTGGPRDVSLKTLPRNPKPTTHGREESLSASLTLLASGLGLISDGYQNSLLSIANVVFVVLYPVEYTSTVSTRVSNALLVGDIVGQLFVGLVCDRLGRKIALVGTTLLIVLGATLATAAHGVNGSVPSFFWFLTIARGITGVGVGGEYPASSTSASESANEKSIKSRGPMIIMVTNFVLSFGGILVISVFLIVLSVVGQQHLQIVWRLCFGIGVLLPLSVLAFRWRMLSSKLYRKGAIKRRVPYWLVLKRYWRSLIGTGGAWFVFDFVVYPYSLFSGTIISSIVPEGDIKKTAEWQLLIGAIALPGVFIGAYLCNLIGRRNTMILGFTGYVLFGLLIGIAYDKITANLPLFVALYGMIQSMGNVGPGNMTILTSAEAYATPVRGTCYGISAAIGKVGAALGTQVFTPIQIRFGKRWTFVVAAFCGALGILVTYFCVPDMTGVDLADEDAKFMAYLAEHGWDGEVGEDGDKQPVGAPQCASGKEAADEKMQ